jgi:hypothetical protein
MDRLFCSPASRGCRISHTHLAQGFLLHLQGRPRPHPILRAAAWPQRSGLRRCRLPRLCQETRDGRHRCGVSSGDAARQTPRLAGHTRGKAARPDRDRLSRRLLLAVGPYRFNVEHSFWVLNYQFGFQKPDCSAWPRTAARQCVPGPAPMTCSNDNEPMEPHEAASEANPGQRQLCRSQWKLIPLLPRACLA